MIRACRATWPARRDRRSGAVGPVPRGFPASLQAAPPRSRGRGAGWGTVAPARRRPRRCPTRRPPPPRRARGRTPGAGRNRPSRGGPCAGLLRAAGVWDRAAAGQRRHVFVRAAPDGPAEPWSHAVEVSGLGRGMVFEYAWMDPGRRRRSPRAPASAGLLPTSPATSASPRPRCTARPSPGRPGRSPTSTSWRSPNPAGARGTRPSGARAPAGAHVHPTRGAPGADRLGPCGDGRRLPGGQRALRLAGPPRPPAGRRRGRVERGATPARARGRSAAAPPPPRPPARPGRRGRRRPWGAPAPEALEAFLRQRGTWPVGRRHLPGRGGIAIVGRVLGPGAGASPSTGRSWGEPPRPPGRAGQPPAPPSSGGARGPRRAPHRGGRCP